MVLENCMVRIEFKDNYESFLLVRISGDLMYLQVTTCEEKSFHITACTKGFYVSQ